ncbi:keratin, type I cytoskeletal 18-like [Hoplias malabaricus]|uniref:keratin, type I cytoskeletal 18-like n=1 Tax=Hoplias malabaricus TaxID=27720 RepID=UPI0034619F93
MSLSMNSFSSTGLPGSPWGSVSGGDSKENLRGLNSRLALYLEQVRELQDANSKLEAQIRERASSRSSERRDWSQYEKTIAHLREQLKDLMMDNAQLMLQIDNARLAADDFKNKFEAEHAVWQGVDQDVANLRRLIDETNMSRMQLESEIESLKQELIFLHKNHEEDLANLQGQIQGSSVDVQMEARQGDDLSETIGKIRQQYEKATQKSREDMDAWYQTKFDTMTSEVSKSTESLQQGKSEVNDLRRERQALEIDLQALRSMNHTLEDNLRDTTRRYAQEMNHHNATVQELEAELGEVRAHVARQGAEYQALLNVKTKLEQEIATYQQLLEGSCLEGSFGDTDNHRGGNVRDTGTREDTDFKGAGTREDTKFKGAGTREDTYFKGAGTREDTNFKGAGTREDTDFKGAGTREDTKFKGASTREDTDFKGAGTREDTKFKGAGTREDTDFKGAGTREDSYFKGAGTREDGNVKDNSAPEDANGNVSDTGVPDDDFVAFSLEEALNAERPAPTPEQIQIITEEVEVESHAELKLNAANGTVEEQEKGRDRGEGEEGEVTAEKESPAVENEGGKVEEEKEEVKEEKNGDVIAEVEVNNEVVVELQVGKELMAEVEVKKEVIAEMEDNKEVIVVEEQKEEVIAEVEVNKAVIAEVEVKQGGEVEHEEVVLEELEVKASPKEE